MLLRKDDTLYAGVSSQEPLSQTGEKASMPSEAKDFQMYVRSACLIVAVLTVGSTAAGAETHLPVR